MEQTRYRYVLAAALSASAACVNPLQPERARLKDPGTVIVTVRDADGEPLKGVWVYVELPNDVGTTLWEGTPTAGDGTVTFRYVPAGERTVEVKPPAAYSVDGSPKRRVTVVRGKTTTTQFTLQRK